MKLPYHYTEITENDAAFAAYYDKHILPLKDEVEKKRLHVVQREPVRKSIAVIVSCFCIVVTVILLFKKIIFIGRRKRIGEVIFGFCLAIRWFFVGRYRQKYFNATKEQVIPLIVQFVGDFSYELQGKIDTDYIRSHGIFPTTYASFNAEDYIVGEYRELYFECVDLKYSSRNRWFRGMGMLLEDMPFIEGHIIVKPRDTYRFAKEETVIRKKFGLVPYSTGDEHFDFQLAAYATSKELAETLLTPNFQKTLLQLGRMFGSANMRFSYKEQQIMMAIPTENNLLEFEEIDVPSINEACIRRLLQELQTILKVIDILHTSIIKKQ